MTEHIRLIAQKLEHLYRMEAYLDYSVGRVNQILPISDISRLSPEQHESLAAFRVRFGEFQEHLGKTMRAVALEEEADADRFGSVLAFMEKIGIVDSAETWKVIRELRNSINHEYEEDSQRLGRFFEELVKSAPLIIGYFRNLKMFCRNAYGIVVNNSNGKSEN